LDGIRLAGRRLKAEFHFGEVVHVMMGHFVKFIFIAFSFFHYRNLQREVTADNLIFYEKKDVSWMMVSNEQSYFLLGFILYSI
jgi:hypothetical protein